MMVWITNAGTIANLLLTTFGLDGYVYGIVTYLKNKASSPKQDTSESQQASTSSAKKSSIPYKPLSWLQWTEFFGQGLVDTADFILTFLLHKEYHPEREPARNKVGGCAVVFVFGGLFLGFVLTLILYGFLSALGMPNASNTAIAIVFILFFTAFLFVYIYHVGLRVEHHQLHEQYQEMRRQPSPGR